MSDRLYVVQVVIAVEHQWFAVGTDGPPVRTTRHHHVTAQLFEAADAETAYRTAVGWLPGFSDSFHDEDGTCDLIRVFAVGIHELEALSPRMTRLELSQAVGEVYGVEVGRFDPAAVDAAGAPLVRARSELDVFRSPP